MKPLSRFVLALFLSTFGSVVLPAANLPLTVIDTDGAWRTRLLQRKLPPDFTVEAVVLPATNVLPRFLLLSTPRSDPTESIEAFARRTKLALSSGTEPLAIEEATHKHGFDGRIVRFRLSDEKTIYRCELFVFFEEKTAWGVLYLSANDAATPSGDPFAIFHRAMEVPEGVVGMAPFKVKDQPLTGFPISFEVVVDQGSGRIAKITVSDVPLNSITDRAGVRVGDEIIAINGRKSQEFAGGLGKKSELGLIFLNREPRDEVQLEILTPGDKKTRKVTLDVPDPFANFGMGGFRRGR